MLGSPGARDIPSGGNTAALGNRKMHGCSGCMSMGEGAGNEGAEIGRSQAGTPVRNLRSIQSPLSLHKGENHASSSTSLLQWKKMCVMRWGEKA